MSKHSRTAFTLIELLIVVTIIIVLMGILIPTLSRSRERARTVKCQSNLRQIYLAAEMYATDNNDKFPDYRTIGSYGVRVAPGKKTTHQYYESDLPEVYGIAAVLDGLNKEGGNGVDERVGPSYLSGRSKIWICPSHRPDIQELGNTYQVYPAPTVSVNGRSMGISEMKMSVRNAFTSTEGTSWITCGLQYRPYRSGVFNSKLTTALSYPQYEDENGINKMWRYPHLTGAKNCMNILNLNGRVYLNNSNNSGMANDIR